MFYHKVKKGSEILDVRAWAINHIKSNNPRFQIQKLDDSTYSYTFLIGEGGRERKSFRYYFYQLVDFFNKGLNKN